MFTLMLMLVTYWSLTLRPVSSEIPFTSPDTPHSNSEISLVPLASTTGPSSILYWHSRYGFKLTRRHSKFHILLGLLLGGQVEFNPGPRTPKYPCGECSKAVRWGKSIACDTCDRWFHKDCLQMTSTNYECHKELSWYCHSCALPNSSSLFESFKSDVSSPGAPTHQSSPVSTPRPKKRINRLKFQIINFDSLPAKKDELGAILQDENLDIVLGCETHLSENILNSEILPPGYNAIPRRDRNRLGGGVIIIHKSNLSVSVIRKPRNCEFLAMKVQCAGKQPVIFSVAYRRPTNDENYMKILCQCIKDVVSSHPKCAHWFGGDFNLPDIDWATESITGNQYRKSINEIFIKLLQPAILIK